MSYQHSSGIQDSDLKAPEKTRLFRVDGLRIEEEQMQH